MKDAAADLEFETAARLRDEIKRLQATELALADDPLARQSAIEEETGGYQGARKYGARANLTPKQPASRVRKPTLDEMGPGTDREVPASAVIKVDSRVKAGAFGEKIRGPHKPTLDEMGPHASLSVPTAGAVPAKPKPDPRTSSPPNSAGTRTIDIPAGDAPKSRRGRAKKTGRPGA